MRTSVLVLIFSALLFSSCASGTGNDSSKLFPPEPEKKQLAIKQADSTVVQAPPVQPDSVVMYPDTFYYKVPKDYIPVFSAIMSGQMGTVSVDMWKEQVGSVNVQLRAQLKKIKNPNATPSTKIFK